MIMEGNLFERCLVKSIEEVAKANKWKQKPLAVAAWGDRVKDPGTKWRKIRNGTDPRGLLVCDAFDLAEAMGESFVEICGLAMAKMRAELNSQASENPQRILPPLEDREALSSSGEHLQKTFEEVQQ